MQCRNLEDKSDMTKDEQVALTKYDLLYEARMTRVESTCESLMYEVRELRKDMRTDFRWLLGMMIALAGLMAHGFHWF
jgi:hypothetical protein